MIAIDELNCVANRMQTLIDNSDSVDERFMAFVIKDSIIKMSKQYANIATDPAFKQQAEEWAASFAENTNK